MASSFGATPDGLELVVLDTTDPLAIAEAAERLPPGRTLFIAASKSGSTIETRSQLEFFWERVERELPGGAGRHFIAITDPGSPLAALAGERGFRRVFENPPDIGGRYSALSYFGLLPAALAGGPGRGGARGSRLHAPRLPHLRARPRQPRCLARCRARRG